MPASTPIIQASPRTPPPPRTSTSGRERIMTTQATHAAAYVITYGCMSSSAAVQNGVGTRIRALREAMDLSLRDLAERSGVSAPMLSQVERGETSPTLQVATRIAAGLELRLSQLLRLDEAGTVTIVRAAERRKGGSPEQGHAFEVLTAP